MKTVAFVPLRLNSKRVPGKNLKDLGGKPLLRYIFETLLKVEGIDEIYAFCSNEEVIEYLPDGIKFLKREEQLDGDEILGEKIYDSFCQNVKAGFYILAHATSPFIREDSIKRGLDMVKSGKYDSAFSVEKKQTFAWYRNKPLNYSPARIPRTQELEPVYLETSAFFVFTGDLWLRKRQRIGNRPYRCVVSPLEAVDIDNPEDFEFAKKIIG